MFKTFSVQYVVFGKVSSFRNPADTSITQPPDLAAITSDITSPSDTVGTRKSIYEINRPDGVFNAFRNGTVSWGITKRRQGRLNTSLF